MLHQQWHHHCLSNQPRHWSYLWLFLQLSHYCAGQSIGSLAPFPLQSMFQGLEAREPHFPGFLTSRLQVGIYQWQVISRDLEDESKAEALLLLPWQWRLMSRLIPRLIQQSLPLVHSPASQIHNHTASCPPTLIGFPVPEMCTTLTFVLTYIPPRSTSSLLPFMRPSSTAQTRTDTFFHHLLGFLGPKPHRDLHL